MRGRRGWVCGCGFESASPSSVAARAHGCTPCPRGPSGVACSPPVHLPYPNSLSMLPSCPCSLPMPPPYPCSLAPTQVQPRALLHHAPPPRTFTHARSATRPPPPCTSTTHLCPCRFSHAPTFTAHLSQRESQEQHAAVRAFATSLSHLAGSGALGGWACGWGLAACVCPHYVGCVVGLGACGWELGACCCKVQLASRWLAVA